MEYIGFLCRINSDHWHPSGALRLYRILPIAQLLESMGKKLFIYSPRHLNPNTGMVSGCTFEKDRFVQRLIPMPTITGNWFAGSNHPIKEGELPVKEFFTWAKEHHRKIFPHPAFANLTGNKLSTYNTVKNFDEALLPQGESWENRKEQLKKYLNQSKKIYIKPVHGKEGNHICTVTQQNTLTLAHFIDKEKHIIHQNNLTATTEKLKQFCITDSYMIQQGITNKIFPNPFSLRIVTINDGNCWQAIHWVIAAKEPTDVSNLYQGGNAHHSLDFLSSVLSMDKAQDLLDRVLSIATKLAKYLNSMYENQLFEMAFDFVVDDDLAPYLLEINRISGVAVPHLRSNKSLKGLLHLSETEQAAYQRYLIPLGEYTGKFLLKQHKRDS